MRSVITGTGIGVPPHVVTNEALARLMDTSDEWIRVRSGIQERRYAETGQGSTDLGVLAAQGEAPQLVVARGEGCVKCRSTGLFGRTGVFEVLAVEDKLRRLIRGGADAKEIMKQARQDGMMTLREAAIRKLAKGLTSFEEVTRVTVEG